MKNKNKNTNKKKYNHLVIINPKEPIYPNAADHSYFVRKTLDVVTALASGCGLFVAMIFLVTMI